MVLFDLIGDFGKGKTAGVFCCFSLSTMKRDRFLPLPPPSMQFTELVCVMAASCHIPKASCKGQNMYIPESQHIRFDVCEHTKRKRNSPTQYCCWAIQLFPMVLIASAERFPGRNFRYLIWNSMRACVCFGGKNTNT